MPYINCTVPLSFEGEERLDKYIASLSGGINRSRLKSGVINILVNGKKEKVSHKVKAGDLIDIEYEDNVPSDIEPEDIPLEILYEDENVCVVNKKQGMVTHPALGNWKGTLVNALLFHWGLSSFPELKNASPSAILKNRRPGIVHRLDKETSGIIITAKNRETEDFLASQFRNHKAIVKEYIAICKGRPKSKKGVIKTGIIRDPKDRKKFKAVPNTEEGKVAETFYRCISCYGEYSLLRLRITTGRTHQIRVHLKYLNCPVLGDGLYGKQDKKFPKATLMLNSHLLKIRIPGKEEPVAFKSSTPERFLRVMKRLKKDFKKSLLED